RGYRLAVGREGDRMDPPGISLRCLPKLLARAHVPEAHPPLSDNSGDGLALRGENRSRAVTTLLHPGELLARVRIPQPEHGPGFSPRAPPRPWAAAAIPSPWPPPTAERLGLPPR